MSLILAMFGLGLGWMNRRPTTVAPPPPSGMTGQPMGLLLTLTYAS